MTAHEPTLESSQFPTPTPQAGFPHPSNAELGLYCCLQIQIILSLADTSLRWSQLGPLDFLPLTFLIAAAPLLLVSSRTPLCLTAPSPCTINTLLPIQIVSRLNIAKAWWWCKPVIPALGKLGQEDP